MYTSTLIILTPSTFTVIQFIAPLAETLQISCLVKDYINNTLQLDNNTFRFTDSFIHRFFTALGVGRKYQAVNKRVNSPASV